MNVSELLVKLLEDNHAEHCFSIVGGHSLFLNKAFSDSSLDVTYFHNEQATTMAADSYFRVAKKIAVVNITAAPAALNALNGVYGAYVDSIPMIVVSGNPKQSMLTSSTGLPLRQYGDQEFDGIIDVVKKITKHSICLRSGMDYELEIKKSIEIAVSGKPGPVWIDVPMDVQSQEVVCYNQAEKREEIVVAKNSEQRLDLKTMDLIFQKISISKRPILYIGPQIKIFSAEEELRKLSDILNIPIVTSWNAHDVIETSNEKYSGRPGLRGERAGNFNVYAADFILAIGTKLSIRQVGSTTNSFSPNSYKVMVDIDLSELDKPHLDIDLKVNLNPKEFISALVLYLKNSKYITPKNHLTWTKRAKKVWDDCRPKYHDYDVLDSINPYHFLSDFFTVLPENRVLVLGNGISVVGAFQMAEIKKNQLMFQNVGCASMGYDIPASIGASLGCGEKKVVCLTGDGSIQMNLQELQTIIGYDLNIAIFVINNGGYDSIKQSQISVFGKGVEFHGIDPDSGVTFPSLEKISIAYGYEYFKISEYENMESIAKMALSASRSICEVFVRHDQSFEPKVGISKKADGTIVGGSLINMNPIMQEDEVESILNFLRGQS